MSMPDSRPLTVAVTTNIGHKDFHHLCPGRKLVWGRCTFLLNPPRGSNVDFWIVFSEGRIRDYMICQPENTLFYAGEPPAKKNHPVGFYKQFHHVLGTYNKTAHPRAYTDALGLNWHVGLRREDNRYIYGHDELTALAFPKKINAISVICSNLSTTPGQRARLQFLLKLKELLGDKLIHYGRGFTPISDKLDGILPYRFHLVLENSISDFYWTEKLSDAYLGWAYPFYAGCPNLKDFFPTDSFARIDINQPEHARQMILEACARPPDANEISRISAARNVILNDYNLFARFSFWAERLHRTSAVSTVKINTHKAFRPFPKNVLFRIKSRFIRPVP